MSMANPFLDPNHPIEYVDGREVLACDPKPARERQTRPQRIVIDLQINTDDFLEQARGSNKTALPDEIERILQSDWMKKEELKPFEFSMKIPPTLNKIYKEYIDRYRIIEYIGPDLEKEVVKYINVPSRGGL
jgi:hypothetical protein